MGTCGDVVVTLLRGYSYATTDHFYTTDAAEMSNAVHNLGYTFEGDAAFVLQSPGANANGIPLYRTYSTSGTDHFYTTNAAERDSAIANLGYSDEGITAYVYPSALCGTVPLFRTYSPGDIDHFYTTNAAERDNAVKNLGYVDEGIAAYVYGGPQ